MSSAMVSMVSFFSSEVSSLANRLVDSLACGRMVVDEKDGVVSTVMNAAADILVAVAAVMATTTAAATALVGRALLLLWLEFIFAILLFDMLLVVEIDFLAFVMMLSVERVCWSALGAISL